MWGTYGGWRRHGQLVTQGRGGGQGDAPGRDEAGAREARWGGAIPAKPVPLFAGVLVGEGYIRICGAGVLARGFRCDGR